MSKLDSLMAKYAISHQNHTNKLIHIICVPAIMFSIIGILMCVPLFKFNTAYILIIGASIYYFTLSKKYFGIMLPIVLVMYLANIMIARSANLFVISISIFVISWIFQFIGHKIEGKKPSFLDDLHFLLIGPLWVIKTLFKLK
ncbi:MAG: DUF962 domain-containing protein [Bacteriovoracaceae bacterium]|jgi:uncharacterized membrane protein YGL010W|nr:DUF962 domain-containing protein [Bacteriovoracaceae bacterium]